MISKLYTNTRFDKYHLDESGESELLRIRTGHIWLTPTEQEEYLVFGQMFEDAVL